MSAVIVLTPVVVASWPMIAGAITAAAAAAGFTATSNLSAQTHNKNCVVQPKVELDVPNSEVIADTLSADASMSLERDGVKLTFSRDVRGGFKTCVEGDRSKEELRQIGQDMAGRVVQQYVYRRLQNELEAQGFVTVAEEQEVDQTIRMVVRRYEE